MTLGKKSPAFSRIILSFLLALAVGSTVMTAGPQHSIPIFIDGVLCYSIGDYDEAEPRFSHLVRQYPDEPAFWYYLGLSQLARHKTDDAAISLSRAASLDPDNNWIKEQLAAANSAAGNLKGALAIYEDFIKEGKARPEHYYTLLSLYVNVADYDKAFETLEHIEVLSGKTEASLLTRFDILRAKGDNASAYAALEEDADEVQSPYILSLLADYQMGMFNDSTALAYYDRALAIDPRNTVARFGKTDVFRLTRRYPEYFAGLDSLISDPAFSVREKANYFGLLFKQTDSRFMANYSENFDRTMDALVGTHPSDTVAYVTAGEYYMMTGRMDRASEEFRTLAELDRESRRFMGTYIQLLLYRKMYDDALAASREAFERFDKDPEWLELCSYILYEKKDYEGVIQNCNRLLSIYPAGSTGYATTLSVKADMCMKTGMKKEAMRLYEKVLKLKPDDASSLNNYAWHLCEEGKNLKKALKMSKKAVELSPETASFLDTYAWILHQLGRNYEARLVFKEAMLHGGKESRVILEHYAVVLDAVGDDAAANYMRMLAQQRPEE